MAQVLAIIAFLISVAGWYVAWLAGLLALIILLLECCCDISRGMFMAAAVLGFVAAIGEFLVAAGVVDFTLTTGHLAISTDGLFIMAIVAGVLWLIAASVAYQYGR